MIHTQGGMCNSSQRMMRLNRFDINCRWYSRRRRRLLRLRLGTRRQHTKRGTRRYPPRRYPRPSSNRRRSKRHNHHHTRRRRPTTQRLVVRRTMSQTMLFNRSPIARRDRGVGVWWWGECGGNQSCDYSHATILLPAVCHVLAHKASHDGVSHTKQKHMRHSRRAVMMSSGYI